MLALWNKLKRRRDHEAPPPDANRRIRRTYEGDVYNAPEFKLEATWLTDAGCVRENNEDNARFQTTTKASLMVVADGVGGHSAGEEASRLAVESICQRFFDSSDAINDALREAFAEANQAIFRAAQSRFDWQGMGTTATALVISNGQAFAAQVGDSRLYLVRDERIYQLSEDHSAVMEMVRMGVMTLAEAEGHEDRNIILRALGTKPEVAVTVWEKPFPVRVGDRFVLCTDGLFDLVSDEEIKTILTAAPADQSTGDICRQLVELAKANGGYDNITVGIVQVTTGAFHSKEQS
ncbi:MAG: Stp1/IreP family PP2C-type Ser/Thr phosphatase [Acidobacteria bacterium]|nr:Stp1/IreP family PP2C-type Ser/Thr phosphatase [Acidobacteriota bacterium]